ncbi:uncharacterized protein [Leuresthes tenuis]|uniref:uncharacterized protein n=1 Tax=Leuresthes tenuis TaxID=355514 RepID=UPI003B515313
MDLSLLPTSASENNKQMTGTRFTVRSANSPSYSLTRRPGVRKRETEEGVGEIETHGTYAGTNGTLKESVSGYQARTGSSSVNEKSEERDASGHQLPTTLNQNRTADKNITNSGGDGGENSLFISRGRTEWKKCNLPSRSKSLNSRTGTGSPTRADVSTLPAKRGAVLSEHLEGQSARVETDLTGRGTSSLHGLKSVGYFQDRSPENHTSQTLDSTSWGHSLPSRFRSGSLPNSRSTENLFGPTGGRSIRERIKELFESAGEKSAGGTFPRRLSSGKSKSPAQSRMSQISTVRDDSESERSFSPRTNTSGEQAPVRQFHRRNSEEDNWGKWMVESGTKSLDRARSRLTTGGLTPANKQNTLLEETFRKSPGFREKSASGSKEDIRANLKEEMSEINALNGTLRERTERIKLHERKKETNEGAKEQTELKNGSTDEDVFETAKQKIAPKTAEEKKSPEMLSFPSTTSVRNKISQFEALTQRAAGQVTMPRRTFSVPTQISRGRDGVKKSRSAKEIGGRREKWEGLREGGEEEMAIGKGKKLGSERSLSVDEVGLGLGKVETGGNDLVGESKNNFSEDFDKYSRLKSTLHISLNEEAQRRSRKMNIDETDFSKVSSPEEFTKRDASATAAPSPHPSSVQPSPHHEMTSPVSDDDKTPTNSPNDSPFMSPALPESATPVTDKRHKSPSLVTKADKKEDSDSPPLPVATTSLNNLSKLPSSDVNTVYSKGKKSCLDLNAWVAGLHPEYKSWNMGDNDFEDDDESTQRDEDSNYDSDSGESSVTITSNMSQSDRRSYSVSLSDLCNFAGADFESDNDQDEWLPSGRRSASLSSDVSGFSCVSLLPTEELDRLVEDVRTLGDDTLQDYSNVQVVVLHKEVGVGLGFSLAGGADQNKPITVHRVFHSGVAAQEGSIREGDPVLSINGTALCGSAHWEALKVLKRAKTRNTGVVVLRRSDVRGGLKNTVQENNEGETQAQHETGQRVCVQLEKNNRDLGFSLQGGVGSSEGNRPLTIQKIFQGGPVDKVCSGDEVLEIQGRSMTEMRRLEAWTFIKSIPPGPVDVVLSRPLKHLQT